MEIRNANITSLIPQKPPFVMVDQCISHDEQFTKSIFKIMAENVLVDSGYFTGYGLIENMAQTAAIRSGIQALHSGEKSKTGFIGTLNNAHIYQLPEVGSELITTVHQTTQVLNIIVIKATCHCADILIADCQMKIVLMDEF